MIRKKDQNKMHLWMVSLNLMNSGHKESRKQKNELTAPEFMFRLKQKLINYYKKTTTKNQQT